LLVFKSFLGFAWRGLRILQLRVGQDPNRLKESTCFDPYIIIISDGITFLKIPDMRYMYNRIVLTSDSD